MTATLAAYTGNNIPDKLTNEKRRNCFIANRNSMKANYLDTVDAALVDSQILMCDETYGALYAPPAPSRYKKGSRPVLEAYVNGITSGCTSDFERVVAIVDNLKMLYEKCRGKILFYGGNEEDLLSKGEQLC